PGFFSADVEESGRSLRSLVHMCFTQELSAEDLYLMLGYNLSVPPRCAFTRRSAYEAQAAAGTPATCRSSPFGSAKKAGPAPWLILSGKIYSSPAMVPAAIGRAASEL